MKKLLLFVIACTLGLFGAVNAQETITIGNESQTNYSLPIEVYFPYSISQQSYSKTEIADAGGYAGNITSVAFKTGDEYSAGVRKLRVFMTNIDTENEVTFDYVGNGYYSLPNLDGLVFEGEVNFVGSAWNTIEFQTPFAYNGNHLLITVADDTGENQNDIYFAVHQKTAYDANNNSINWAANVGLQAPADPTSNISAGANGVRNQIQLTFSAAGEGGEEPTPEPEPEPTIPAAPANLVATANGQNSITLTWEAVEGATSYNIYSTAAGNVPAVTATEYTYENLEAGTEYCFEVTAENAAGESYDAAYACATTEEAEIEEPVGPVVDLTKQYRVKANSLNKYLYVLDNDAHADGTNGGVVIYQTVNDDAQLFTLEDAGNGAYYFKSATGYYIYCQAWNVDAYSTTAKTALKLVDQGDGSFRLQNTNNNKYFKVQQVGMFYFPFCDCDGVDCTIETWSLEAVEGGSEEPEPTPVAPAAPQNVVATANGQNSIIVTWNAVDGAAYYIVYKDGQMWDQVNGTTYTSTGLTAGTEYCYAVQAYDANDLESELSETVCETTEAAIEIPEGVIWSCSVEFVLGDTYGDGWNGNNLYVSYGDVTEKLTLTGGKSTTYVLDIPKGTHVTVTYKPEGSYQYENTFGVRYYGDTEYICTQYTIDNNQTYTHEFDVNCEPSMPSVPALTATATGGSTIVLTIEGAGAESYNIYEGGELFAEGVTGSTYTVEGLESETEYCFTATSINFLGETEQSAEACATTMKAGSAIVQVGTGTTNTYQAPINNYWSSNSVSQMIYTEEEIGYGSGKVTSISFKQNEGGNHTRALSVYLKNISRDSFGNGNAEWEALEEDMCVYQGDFTFGTTGWVTIPVQNEFIYEAGSNLMVCVVDNTGSYPANSFEGFAADVVSDIKTLFGTSSASTDPLNITTYSYPLLLGTDNLRPIAKFVLEPAPVDVKVKPETIAFGDAKIGEFWSENGAVTIPVTVRPIMTTVTNIECDNEFFVLPTIDLTASPIEFEVAYDQNAAAGEYTGNLTITYGDGETKVVPMTATAYAPATADVIELAQEITFTENAYTDTPVFASLHDDYNLPAEEGANAPDAVYAFELTKESTVAVDVTGTNANYAIYKAEDLEGNGPKADNNYVGEIVATDAPVSFFYDFSEENVLENNFTLIDKDNDGYNWRIETATGIDGATLKSDSYTNISLFPDNYIVTKEKYEITANSTLTFNYLTSSYPDKFGVEVSTDGETFINVWNEKVASGGNVVEQVVPLSDYAGQFVYIALRHYESNGNEGWYVLIDDLRLESGLPNSFPAGKYYLVAAAEDEFTVNVAIEALEGEEPTPTVKAYRLESVGTAWGATEYIYDEENTNTVVAVDEDGFVTEVTYNEAGQIASAIASYEDVDEEGNPIEVIVSGVEYEYDENGVWTSYTETVQGWFGGTVTTETVLGYDAEGRLVSLTSPEYVRTIAYNEAGLISEVVEGYALIEEEGGEEEGGEEEGDDNGIAPLSETEIEYSSKITFEYDAEGRLVKKEYYYYDAYETMEFYLDEVETYEYDENGNCIAKKAYLLVEDAEGNFVLESFPYSVTENIYDLTISNEDVYSFEYPHFAFINYVEPSYVNILVKEMSYYSYYDEELGEIVSHSYDVTAYNYNPEVLSLPLQPMNLTAEVLSATEVELAWAGSPDAESFTIYQGETVLAEGIVDPYYTVENLELGVEYCFAVMATNSVGNSEVSETVCVTIELPAAPANLVAEATSDTEIALTWDEVPGIWTYNVYQVVEVEGETTYELLGEAWWTEYTVSELTAETKYSFVVKAVSNVGESDASNVATATTLAPQAPEAPIVTATVIYDTVRLEWEAVEGALYYNLYYGDKLLAEKFEETRVDIQVPEIGTYCFTVTALNEVGESDHSEEVCGEVVVPEGMVVPAAPVLEATLDGNKAILTWEAVEGATYYDLYIEAASGQDQYLGTATMQSLPISLTLSEHGIYCFYVIANNLVGASEPSNVACVNYGNVGVEENEASFNIYPNPVSDRLVIETEANIEAVTIYTVTGVVVYSEVDYNNNTIDVSDFANGVYIMKVRTENGEAVQRFIKK